MQGVIWHQKEVSFLAEGKKLVEGVPAGTRDRLVELAVQKGKLPILLEGDALILFHMY